MIKIYSLGSSSKGNCFYIYDGYNWIIIDAGFSEKEIQKGFFKIGGNLKELSGIILTHEHNDHAKGINAFNGVNKYMTKGTFEGLKNKNKINKKKIKFIEKGEVVEVGNYKVKPFQAFHDTNDPVSFLLKNSSGEKIVYITDTGKQPNLVKNADVYIIESNHDEEVISKRLNNPESSKREKELCKRITSTHLNTNQTINYLNKCMGDKTKHIILMHLSPSNQSPEVLMGHIRKKTKFKEINFIHPTKHNLLKNHWEVGFIPRRLEI